MLFRSATRSPAERPLADDFSLEADRQLAAQMRTSLGSADDRAGHPGLGAVRKKGLQQPVHLNEGRPRPYAVLRIVGHIRHSLFAQGFGPTRMPKTGHRTRLTEADMTGGDPYRSVVGSADCSPRGRSSLSKATGKSRLSAMVAVRPRRHRRRFTPRRAGPEPRYRHPPESEVSTQGCRAP